MAYAIPTWNRAATVTRAVHAALEPSTGEPPAQVLVHVDGSTDDTVSRLRRISERHPRVLHLSVSEANAGYARALVSLLRLAQEQVDVVVLCADDDVPLPAGLRGVSAEMARSSVDMLSTPVPSDDRYGPDRRTPRARAATPPELRAVAAHAPGIVLRTSALDGPLALLEARLEKGCAFARAYPQAVVAAFLLARGRVRWWTIPVVRVGSRLPTGIRGDGGDVYAAPRERWEQWRSFQDLLGAEIRTSDGPTRSAYRAMRTAEEVHLLPHLRAGFCQEAEDVMRFDRAARRTYGEGPVRRLVRRTGGLRRGPERAYLLARLGDAVARRFVRRRR